MSSARIKEMVKDLFRSLAIGGLFLVIGLTAAILGILSFIIESADARMADKLGVRRIR